MKLSIKKTLPGADRCNKIGLQSALRNSLGNSLSAILQNQEEMMFKKKRIIAVIAAMMMVLTMAPGAVFAAEDDDDDMGIIIDITGAGSVKVDEEATLTAEVDGVESEDYHIHWAVTDGKKRINFIDENQNASKEAVGPSVTIRGIDGGGDAVVTVSAVSGKEHGDSCSAAVLGTGEKTVTVISADTKGPGPQGKDPSKQSVEMISPVDITQTYPQEGQAATKYENVINKTYDEEEDLIFVFRMGKEMGAQYDEDKFLANAVSQITVKDTKGKIVASAATETLSTEYDEDTRNVTLFVDTLEPGTYVLTFGADMYVNNSENTLGVPVSFQFKVTTDRVLVKSVKITKFPAVLKQGASETLKAAINPANADYQDIEWKSSNPKVVSVNAAGKVTAKSGGTATITAISDDGLGSGEKKATCKITVLGNTKIKLSSKKGAVTVKCTKVSGGVKYQILRGTKKSGSFKAVASAAKTSYTDKKVKKGKTYYYKARTMKKVGGKTYYGNQTAAAKIKVK